MATADRAQLIAELTLDDKFTKPLARIDKRLGAFSGAVNRNLARGLDSALTTVARGVVNVGKGITTAAIDWEDAFAGVRKTIDETADTSFDELSSSLRELSTRMPITAVELAAIAEAGGAMGIEADSIAAFTEQVAILASTTNLTSDDAATALGQLQNVIGLTGDEFDEFADTLVYLGNKGASTESTILEITRRAGAVGKSFGLSKDQILGWSAAAANLGMEADQAGGSLQGMLTKLQPAIFKGGKTIETVFGMSGKRIRRMFDKDAGKGLETFVKKLRAMPKDARFDAIEKLFGRDRGIRRLITGLIGDVDGLSQTLADANKGWFDSAAAQDEFNKRNATVRSAITRLRNGLFDAAVTVGEGFTPALGRAADKLSAFLKVPGNRSDLKELGADIGRMIDGVDWNGLLGHARDFMGILKTTSGYAKTLWDGFSALPSDVKSMLVGFAAINKLSGGAPVKIAVDFAKEGFGKLFERGSFTNPMYVIDITKGGKGGNNKDTPGTTGKGSSRTGAKTPVSETTRSAGSRIKDAAKGGLLIVGTAITVQGDTVKGARGGTLTDTQRYENLKAMIAKGMGGSKTDLNGGTVISTLDKLATALGRSTAGTDPSDPRYENRKKMDQVKAAIDASKTDTIAEQIATKNALAARSDAVKAAVASGAVSTGFASRAAGQGVQGSVHGAAAAITSAIYSLPAPIVDVDVNVSATNVVRQTTNVYRSSQVNSSDDDGWGGR